METGKPRKTVEQLAGRAADPVKDSGRDGNRGDDTAARLFEGRTALREE